MSKLYFLHTDTKLIKISICTQVAPQVLSSFEIRQQNSNSMAYAVAQEKTEVVPVSMVGIRLA